MTAVERFDSFLGWVTVATCQTRWSALQRVYRIQRLIPDARFRVR